MKKLIAIIILTCILTSPVLAQWPYDNKPMMGTFLNHAHPLGRPVGFWYMPEGSGNKVFDLSGNGNPLVFTGTPTWQSSKFGSGIYLDAVGDYLLQANNFNLSGNTPITFGGWFRIPPQGGANVHIINIGEANNDKMAFLLVGDPGDDGHIKYGAWGTSWTTTGAYHDNIWHQIYIVYDGSFFYCYVDGLLVDGPNAYVNLNLTALPVHVGSYRGDPANDAFNFVGGIDHLNIWGRGFTASEVALLYREPFCMFAEDDIALMTEGAAPAPTGGQVIMITSLPLLFFGLYLCRKYKAEVLL